MGSKLRELLGKGLLHVSLDKLLWLVQQAK